MSLGIMVGKSHSGGLPPWQNYGVPSKSCTNGGEKIVFKCSSDFRRFRGDVVEIAAVKALCNYSEPQLSIAWPQRIQSKTVNLTRFQQTSINAGIWFGTRVSTICKPCRISYLKKPRLVEVCGLSRLSRLQNHLHCPPAILDSSLSVG